MEKKPEKITNYKKRKIKIEQKAINRMTMSSCQRQIREGKDVLKISKESLECLLERKVDNLEGLIYGRKVEVF